MNRKKLYKPKKENIIKLQKAIKKLEKDGRQQNK